MARFAPLESSWSKFRRARRHLKALDTELGRLISPENEPLGIERQVDEREVVVRVSRIPDFREAGLLLGDSVTNYRAALDHLMWDFVKLGSQPRLTQKEARHVQFPFASRRRDLTPAERQRRGPGLSSAQWDIIGRYQPYSSGDRGRTMRFLNLVSNMDKHRSILPAAIALTEFRASWHLSDCVLSDIQLLSLPKRALQVGAKLASARLTPTGPKPDVKIESYMAIQPFLNRGVLVLPAMFRVDRTVTEILSAFEELI